MITARRTSVPGAQLIFRTVFDVKYIIDEFFFTETKSEYYAKLFLHYYFLNA